MTISIDNLTLRAPAAAGTVVGVLTTRDASGAAIPCTFTLTRGSAGFFVISGNELVTAWSATPTPGYYSVRVHAIGTTVSFRGSATFAVAVMTAAPPPPPPSPPPPPPAPPAPISFVNAADLGTSNGTTNSYSTTYTVGSTSSLLVIPLATTGADDQITVVSNGTVNWSAGPKKLAFDYVPNLYIFYLTNPPSGVHNILITATAARYLIPGIAEYSGTTTASLIDASITNDNSSSATNALTTSLLTSTDQDWTILVAGCSGFSGYMAAGAGATLRVKSAGDTWSFFDSGGPVTPPGSTSMQTTTSDDSLHDISAIMFAIKPSSAVSSPPVPVIALTPSDPVIPDTTPLGAAVASFTVTMSDGSPFTGTIGFAAPYYDAGGIFAISGSNIIVNPSGPGVGPNMTTLTDQITLEAVQ